MSSIDYKEAFDKYYQNKYDFNTSSLTAAEIDGIKKMAREKRVDYALAPIGTGIFDWILKQNSNISFELISFDSEKIDGMLYIPTTGEERAYIILNANKPLVNQIFTAAHEFYHYEKDYQIFKSNPYVCDFSSLKDINEMRASRFAAELLLPEEALTREVKDYLKIMSISSGKDMVFRDYAVISIFLTIRYQMPLKAVIYRLYEEGYIDNVGKYIENYDFIKMVLKNAGDFKKNVGELYSRENNYIITFNPIYQNMEKAYRAGNATREDIISDAEKLNLNMDIIYNFLNGEEKKEDDVDDEELFSYINKTRR